MKLTRVSLLSVTKSSHKRMHELSLSGGGEKWSITICPNKDTLWGLGMVWKVFYIFTPWAPLFEVFSPMRDWELFFKSVLLYNSIIYFHLLPCDVSMHPAEELRMPAVLTLNLIVWYAIAYKILGIRLARNSACAWMVWPDSSHCCLHWKHYIW